MQQELGKLRPHRLGILLVWGHSQLWEIHIKVAFVSLNMSLPFCDLLETNAIFVWNAKKTNLASVANDTSSLSLSGVVSDHGSWPVLEYKNTSVKPLSQYLVSNFVSWNYCSHQGIRCSIWQAYNSSRSLSEVNCCAADISWRKRSPKCRLILCVHGALHFFFFSPSVGFLSRHFFAWLWSTACLSWESCIC